MNIDWNQLAPLLMILFIGVPHGAADSILAIKACRFNSLASFSLFILMYLLLVASVVVGWLYYPALSLMFFLCISAFHFGLGDLSLQIHNQDQPVQKALMAWCLGGAVVFLMPLLHLQEVMPYFQLLTHQDEDVARGILYCGLIYWFIGFMVILSKSLSSESSPTKLIYRNLVLEVIGLAVIYTLFSPLWSFTLYFCFIHTTRHFKSLITVLSNYGMKKQDWIHFILIAGIAIGSILIGSLYFGPEVYSDALFKWVFIGLSALTVPHVVLIDGLRPLRRPVHTAVKVHA